MALKKLTFADAVKFSKKLKIRSYFANPFYLYHNCLQDEKNGEVLIFEAIKIDDTYPLIFLPKNPKNFTNQIISTGFEEDIALIEKTHKLKSKEVLGLEYYYSTSEWIKLEGAKFSDIRKNINKFKKEHDVKLLSDYPEEKILEFLDNWAAEKRKKDVKELTKSVFEQELKESTENLRLIEKYNHKKIFVEEKGELIGFTIFIHLSDNLWVGLMQKTIKGIRGLPQYLYHLKAKEIGGDAVLTTGAEAQDPDLKAFKDSLRPIDVKTIYILRIGSKL